MLAAWDSSLMQSTAGKVDHMKTPFVALLLMLGNAAQAEDYVDAKGKKVTMPLGTLSFADEVVSFAAGKPAAVARDSDPAAVLGVPNYDKKHDANFTTLGCGGTLSLRFTDNALVDGDGPDLYVFEVGPDIEPTSLSLSIDGEQWVEVGRIAGGSAEVDIHEWAKPGEAFHYVRLTDEKIACRSRCRARTSMPWARSAAGSSFRCRVRCSSTSTNSR